jgi:putative endonuclease
MFCVYALESFEAKRIYLGHTHDMDTRLKNHNSGRVRSTAKDRPWRLVGLEKVESKNEARWLERSLKKSQAKRLKWMEKHGV